MSKTEWIRARSTEQIEEREQAILDAAGRVFHEHAYQNVTMRMIADEAGFTRSNLYRYFKTREEIFLTLHTADLVAWVDQVVAAFTRKMSPESFAAKWMKVLLQHERYMELTPLLSLSMEKNTSREVLKDAKIVMDAQIRRTIAAIQKSLPEFDPGDLYEFCIHHYALLAGTWPLGQKTEIQEQVRDELGLPHFEFEPFFRRAILRYLKGIQASAS